ncbi:hypothetical protein SBOR_3147 [Sclerotinia borealis F-4128]|uniref:Uncharacterized protein n=1 Tax=Sclerotinia borealis (strain F-4128) TaxID=1432307 RepID=W9CPK5_SCLBF|nr:hypothetical protein SBOR_3147 [Sclerotinia borealis F-4128]
MGSCCSTADPSPFAQPGRVLSSAPPSNSNTHPKIPTTAPKSSIPRTVGGPARTLGGPGSGSAQEDARRKAAEAAEARLTTHTQKPKGTLGKKLQEEQSQTLETTRKNASAIERQNRDADASADARAYN